MPSGTPKNKKLDSLTGLRCFAALLVVCFHAGGPSIDRISSAAGQVVSKGDLAVGLFYALSGFVLAYNYAGRKTTYRTFVITRIARIYPAYASALLLSLPVFLHGWGKHIAPQTAVASLILVPLLAQAWFPQIAMTWNIPAWSVSVEAFFYLLFPALLPCFINAGKLRLKCLLVFAWCACFIPSLVYLPCLQQSAVPHHSPWAVVGTNALRRILELTPLMRLPEFVAGIVLALLFLKSAKGTKPRHTDEEPVDRGGPAATVLRASLERQPGVVTITKRWRIELATISVIAAILTVMLIPDHHPYPMLHVAEMLPLWCLLIYLLASSAIVSKAFGLPIIVALGEISYSIYIFQQPVSNCVRAGLLFATHIMIKGSYPTLSLFGLYLGVLIVVSFISHYLIEKPAGSWIRWRFAGHVSNSLPAKHAPIDKFGQTTAAELDHRQQATGRI